MESEIRKDREANGRFAEGNPGGPGRPKNEFSLTHLARELLTKEDAAEAKELVRDWIDKAKEGNPTALVQLLDRIDGKVPDKHEVTGEVTHKAVILSKEEYEAI